MKTFKEYLKESDDKRTEVIKWITSIKMRLQEKEPGYGVQTIPNLKNDIDTKNVDHIFNKMQDIKNGNVFNNSTTDIPNYDDILKGYKKVKHEIKMMKPEDYINETMKGFGIRDKNQYIGGFDSKLVADYVNKMYAGDKFPICVLDFSKKMFMQEGRHRSYAAYILNVKEIPVLVIYK
jgi:hypothetical protein